MADGQDGDGRRPDARRDGAFPGVPIGPAAAPCRTAAGPEAWTLSPETREAIAEIERQARRSMLAARTILLD